MAEVVPTEEVKKINLNENGVDKSTKRQNGSTNGDVSDGFSLGTKQAGAARFVAAGSSNATKLPKGFAFTDTDRDAFHYNMNHLGRGYCIIFNHHVFDPATELNERNGTNKDRDNASEIFNALGFTVKNYENLSANAIQRTIENYVYDVDHSNMDCICIIFMSHGENGHLYGRDTTIPAEDLYNKFTADNCPTLAGKPKILFIQACRGDKIDSGTCLVKNTSEDQTDDGSTCVYKVPNHCDFLICWSTVPGHFSWRNTTNGSWFMQALVKIFKQYCNELDLLAMMTMVNQHMIVNFESNCPSLPNMHRKKQSCYIISTLTRKIRLTPPTSQ